MRFLEWTSDLDTGIETIDDQHKQIVEYINALHDAQQQHDKSNTGIIIGQLVDYTVQHFADEEAMLEGAGYPLIEQHKAIHRRFVDKVSQMQARHEMGVDTTAELLKMLEVWLFSHILHHDHGYVKVVKASLSQH